jgi:mannose-1-phosphate guanylyltransferase/phosphomannomutase
MPLSQVVDYLPKVHMAFDQVACPWETKAIVMRTLNGRYQGAHVETIDGIKIHLSDTEWVHIGPNPERPHFELRAEADSTERATALIADYSLIVRELVAHHHPGEF